MSAHALASQTAQLPLIRPRMEPHSWGNMTLHAMEAGIYWGAVGGIRELLMRQSAELETDPWVIFSGGDAEALHRSVAWRGSKFVPDLVLRGLATLSNLQRQSSHEKPPG